MATRPAKPKIVELPPVEDDLLAEDDGTEQALRDQEVFYAEIGQAPEDAIVHVYLVRAGGDEPKIWRGTPSNFNLEALSKKFGSGDYRVMLYAKMETGGSLRRRMNKVIPILLTADEDAAIRNLREGRDAAATGTTGAFNERMIEDLINRSIERLRPPPVAAVDPLAMVERLAGVFKAMIPPPAAPVAPVAPQLDFMTVLNAAKAMQGMMGAGRDPLDDPNDDPSTRLFTRAASTVMGMIEKGNAAQGVTATVAGHVAPAAALIPANPPPAQNEDDPLLMFRLQLKAACRAAAAGEDATEYAGDVYPLISDEDLRSFANDPSWFAKIVQVLPECAHHQAWLTTARDTLVKMAGEDGVLTGTSGGDSVVVPPLSDPAGGVITS